MLAEEHISKVLDLSGLLCPIPVVRTSKVIREIPLGGILEVMTTDPGSIPDLIAWTKMTGNELIDYVETEGNNSSKTYRFQIRRSR